MSSRDPTRTTTLRRRYAQRLRGQFGALSAEIRDGVMAGHLHGNAPKDPEGIPEFEFERDARKVAAFQDWFERQADATVLEVIGEDDNPFIRTSYERGLEHALENLRDVDAVQEGLRVEAVFNLPPNQDALQLLYTRNFQQLEGITNAVSQQLSRELTRGFQEGWSPTRTARELTDRVDKVGKTRSTVLARTETINAHSEATLNMYEEAGAEGVQLEAEFQTAEDDRVCPICEALEGRVFSIDEARSKQLTVAGRDVTPKPPVHPQCRCTLLPVL